MGLAGEGVYLGQFFQKFAARIIPGPARPPMLAASVFGKHPGWDDHMEDVGYQFPEMLNFKRMVYVEGIGGNIDSGSWAHLPDSQRLPQFNHLLIYSLEDSYILASAAASRDGKGRSLYPLITAVQARGYSLADLAEHVGPLILKLRDNVTSCATAADVRSAVNETQMSLDRLTGTLPPQPVKADRLITGSQLSQVLAADGGACDSTYRIIYSLQKIVQSCGHDGANGRTEMLRVPIFGNAAWISARIWLATLRGVFATTYPLMAIECRNAADAAFTDLIIGPAGPGQLFCLRAGTERIPLATEIPFNTDAEFQERVKQYVTECRRLNHSPAPPLPI
jgi:hypothetical protein